MRVVKEKVVKKPKPEPKTAPKKVPRHVKKAKKLVAKTSVEAERKDAHKDASTEIVVSTAPLVALKQVQSKAVTVAQPKQKGLGSRAAVKKRASGASMPKAGALVALTSVVLAKTVVRSGVAATRENMGSDAASDSSGPQAPSPLSMLQRPPSKRGRRRRGTGRYPVIQGVAGAASPASPRTFHLYPRHIVIAQTYRRMLRFASGYDVIDSSESSKQIQDNLDVLVKLITQKPCWRRILSVAPTKEITILKAKALMRAKTDPVSQRAAYASRCLSWMRELCANKTVIPKQMWSTLLESIVIGRDDLCACGLFDSSSNFLVANKFNYDDYRHSDPKALLFVLREAGIVAPNANMAIIGSDAVVVIMSLLNGVRSVITESITRNDIDFEIELASDKINADTVSAIKTAFADIPCFDPSRVHMREGEYINIELDYAGEKVELLLRPAMDMRKSHCTVSCLKVNVTKKYFRLMMQEPFLNAVVFNESIHGYQVVPALIPGSGLESLSPRQKEQALMSVLNAIVKLQGAKIHQFGLSGDVSVVANSRAWLLNMLAHDFVSYALSALKALKTEAEESKEGFEIRVVRLDDKVALLEHADRLYQAKESLEHALMTHKMFS